MSEESVCAEDGSTRFTGRALAVVKIRLDIPFAITIGVTPQSLKLEGKGWVSNTSRDG